jgi:hypothetical protein
LSPSSALIPALLKGGQGQAAGRVATEALRATFDLDVADLAFTQDEYSLNSVSGKVSLTDGRTFFFKFHHEDGEEENVTEYYRAQLLGDAGLPVEVPFAASTVPGTQMVLYELRREPRMADVCADLERARGAGATLPPRLLAARRALDARTGEVMTETLGPAVASSAGAAIHQLFHHRLVDRSARALGGRYRAYYLEDPAFAPLADKRWRVNGVEYRSTLAELATQAMELLAPAALAALPVVTAHGDDHHGNVWVMDGRPDDDHCPDDGGGGGPSSPPLAPTRRLFDPAFAGTDLPALLAPVKATFHNALAHPFWLYHPAEAAQRSTIEVDRGAEVVELTDDAHLSGLRRQVLDSAAELVWAPLLAELARRSWLAGNWRAIVRSALFCCPMLVTNLTASNRSEPVRLLGLARAVAAGSEPASGSDDVSRFLDGVTP